MRLSVASGMLPLDWHRRHAHSARYPSSPPSLAARPVVSSRSTTPKLYTSTFSVTLVVLAHSAHQHMT
uniref:Uncharacterized protein n=1 Tax=Aegilops tauschii subsp. strangulata TaxID=200361 RepID=A0A453FFF6_AEGTS